MTRQAIAQRNKLTLNFIKMKTITELTSAAINIIFYALAAVAITGTLGAIYYLISELSKF